MPGHTRPTGRQRPAGLGSPALQLFYPDSAFTEELSDCIGEPVVAGHEVLAAEAEATLLFADLDVQEDLRVTVELGDHGFELADGFGRGTGGDTYVHSSGGVGGLLVVGGTGIRRWGRCPGRRG